MIQASSLVVHYPRGLLRRPFAALAGLDLDVAEGSFFALIGQNGAGKSTAMACMLGLVRPTSGAVTIRGAVPFPGAPLFREVAYLPEDPTYHAYLTVTEALTYYARLQGVTAPQAAIARVLEDLDLAEHRDLVIARCSKGMKQKVGIAQCLLHQPRLLFLDEPMRGLDPPTVALFRRVLAGLHQQGTTIVMNSHLLGEVEQMADRAAVIDRGRLVVQDSIAHLTRRAADTYDVEVEGAASAPPMITGVTRHDAALRGSLAADDLPAFMEHIRQQQLTLVSCALRRTTLEASFLALVKERPRE